MGLACLFKKTHFGEGKHWSKAAASPACWGRSDHNLLTAMDCISRRKLPEVGWQKVSTPRATVPSAAVYCVGSANDREFLSPVKLTHEHIVNNAARPTRNMARYRSLIQEPPTTDGYLYGTISKCESTASHAKMRPAKLRATAVALPIFASGSTPHAGRLHHHVGRLGAERQASQSRQMNGAHC